MKVTQRFYVKIQFEKNQEKVGENSLFSKGYRELHRVRTQFTISGTVRNDLDSFLVESLY